MFYPQFSMEPEVQTQRFVLRPLTWLVQTVANSVTWVFGYRGVPWRNRITFRVDFQSQVLWTAMMVICQPRITQVIAREILDCKSDLVQAMLFAAAAAGSTASFLWAWLASGRSTLRFIIIPSTLTGLFCVAVAFVPTSQPYLFCLLIFGMYLAFSGVTTVRSAVWHMSYHRAGVGSIVSRFQVFDMIVAAVLAGLAGWLLTDKAAYRFLVPLTPSASYRVLFVVLGLCGILGGVLCLRSPDRGESESRAGSRTSLLAGWRILHYDRAYRQFLGWMMIFGFGTMMGDAIKVLMMYQCFHSSSSPVEIVLYLTLLQTVVQLLTMPFAGRLLDRTNPMKLRVWGGLMWSTSSGLMLIAATCGSLPLLIVSQLFSGVGGGLGSVAWQLGHMHFARKDLVQHYMGLHVSATGLRGLVAPFLAVMLWSGWTAPLWFGRLGGWSIPAIGARVFAGAMVMQVIGGVGFWWMDRRYKTLTPLGPDVEI